MQICCALFINFMSESDIESQKRSRLRRGSAEGRQNAMNDASPDITSPGMIKEMGKENVDKQNFEKKRASSRGNRSRQH
jgi:hypothetical protein